MKVTAIIAEYNPFHNGHKYQIDEIRKNTDADQILVVLSGAFTQRGIPALVDQHIRTRMAIACGADMVLELPVFFSTGSAEYFARGAVSLLDKLGVVSTLHFGSESGSIDELVHIASCINNPTEEQNKAILSLLNQGYSYPKARSYALSLNEETITNPNNILGIEYIRELLRRNSSISPCTLKRAGSSYLEENLDEKGLSSAMAIRNALEAQKPVSSIKSHVPEEVFEIMQSNDTFHPIFLDDFSDYLLYALHTNMNGNLSSFYDVGEALANTFTNRLPEYQSFSAFCQLCKSKNLTYTRVNRSLLHIMLGLKQDFVDSLSELDYVPYARLLGFSENGKQLFSAIKEHSSIPLISKASKAQSQLEGLALDAYQQDLFSSHLYQSIRAKKYHVPFKYEYSQEIIH